MTNKYLEKISVQLHTDSKLRDPDLIRAGSRSALYGAVGGGLGSAVQKALGPIRPGGRLNFVKSMIPAMGAGVGLANGFKTSLKNQIREQELHDAKMRAADNAHTLMSLRIKHLMNKQAEESGKTTAIKDAANLGTIAALGGAGNLAANKLLDVASKRKLISGKPSNKLVFGVGTGLGLAADYIGLKANKAFNDQVDKHMKVAKKE